MKRYKIKTSLAFFMLCVVYNACNEKRIDLQPLSQTEASYFTEEQDFERTMYGVYAKLTDFYWFNSNNPIHGFWLLPGDDITTTGTDPYEIFGNLQPAEGRANTYYRNAYQLISRANIALQKIAEVKDGIYQTPGLKDYHRGEALFLRALMYFNLWNFFGTSPLVTERLGIDKINPPSSEGNQLLDQAITDLQEAATLLPASWDPANRGRATANAANGLLGKALVFRATVTKTPADYSAAITAFNKITDRSLVANFEDNFSASTENNSESLFEHQASQAPGDNVWLPNDFDNVVGAMTAYWGWFEEHWSLFGAAPYKGTQKLVNAFEADDPRLPLTVDSENQDFKKYVMNDQKAPNGVGSVNNPRILRYADVLLLKAEALAQTGSVNEAIALINQVRTRARNMGTTGTPADRPTGADVNTVMDWIMQERFIELAGEESHRWFDLRRWHLGGKLNLANFDFGSARNDVSFDVNKHLYYPIPLNEIDLNPSVRQNPNY